MAEKTGDQVGEVGKALIEAFDSKTRLQVLNPRFHFVPINVEIYAKVLNNFLMEIIKENDMPGRSSVQFFTDEITKYVKDKYSNRKVINVQDKASWEGIYMPSDPSNPTSTSVRIAGLPKTEQKLPALVMSNNQIVGVLFSSYNSAYDGLFRNFLNKTMKKYLAETNYIKYREDAKKEYEAAIAEGKKVKQKPGYDVGYDVGHFPGSKKYSVSPLLVKIDTVIAELVDQMSKINDPNKLAVLANIQQQAEQERKRLLSNHKKGLKISGYLRKNFGQLNEFLISIEAVLVVPQDVYDNKYIHGRVEADINTLVSKMLNINFSRNFIQEVGARAVIDPLKGLKSTNTVAVKKLPDVNLTPKLDIKPAGLIYSSGTTAGTTTIKSSANYRKPEVAGVSLTSLQNLINSHLQDVISANMGSGDSSSILNYRTGRFASSVKVERMTQSREGMITAFYSYMQNPYATFSDGGRQSIPKSRDPKLLIAKSIREIAATKVANRMRSVLA